jgi:hypothetical protein
MKRCGASRRRHMPHQILIIAPEDDLHADVVSERIQRAGHHCINWNTTWFPWKNSVSWDSSGGAHFRLLGCEFALNEIGAVWWRRYRPATINPMITDAHVKQFCSSESSALLQSIFYHSDKVINSPIRERAASLKQAQLVAAIRLGIRIPRTIISNDGAAIRRFVQREKATICKTIVCDYPHSVPTRTCSLADFANDEEVALAPVIVQELVPCALDIRVCIVGDQIFCAQLWRENREEVDWRMTASGWKPHSMSKDLIHQLQTLIRSFGLDMASIDLRLTPEGDYYFFEINPSGQFLFLEIDAGLPISNAVAELLIKRAYLLHEPESAGSATLAPYEA